MAVGLCEVMTLDNIYLDINIGDRDPGFDLHARETDSGDFYFTSDPAPDGHAAVHFNIPVQQADRIAAQLVDIAKRLHQWRKVRQAVTAGPIQPRSQRYTRKAQPPPVEFLELKAGIQASAQDVGADGEITAAALVLVAGMWIRKDWIIKHWTGAPSDEVHRAMRNCIHYKLWKRGRMAVVLGSLEHQYGDLDFWLHAMVACGVLALDGYTEGGETLYRNITDPDERFFRNLPVSYRKGYTRTGPIPSQSR